MQALLNFYLSQKSLNVSLLELQIPRASREMYESILCVNSLISYPKEQALLPSLMDETAQYHAV